jgi:hypothetical protein
MSGALTWEDCAAAGMSQSEAARARGVSFQAAHDYACRTGLRFPDGRKSPRAKALTAERNRARAAVAVQS